MITARAARALARPAAAAAAAARAGTAAALSTTAGTGGGGGGEGARSSHRWTAPLAAVAGFAATAGAAAASWGSGSPAAACEAAAPPAKAATDPAGRPLFTRADVVAHASRDDGVWVTYKDGVYDVSAFLDSHPGGAARLLLAAGGAIDPFWAMYAQHQTEAVAGLLEQYRIGSLDPADVAQSKAGAASPGDPYAADPPRHPALRVVTGRPFNGETPPTLLADVPITPTDLFYVRNHLPVPAVVDEGEWKVRGMRGEREGGREGRGAPPPVRALFFQPPLSLTPLSLFFHPRSRSRAPASPPRSP